AAAFRPTARRRACRPKRPRSRGEAGPRAGRAACGRRSRRTGRRRAPPAGQGCGIPSSPGSSATDFGRFAAVPQPRRDTVGAPPPRAVKTERIDRRHLAVTFVAVAAAPLVPVAGAGILHPDDRALHGRELVTTPTVIHPDDRARHGIEPVAPLATIAVRETGGFDWLDAGIGAAGAAGIVLVAAGSYVLVVRRRRTALSSERGR